MVIFHSYVSLPEGITNIKAYRNHLLYIYKATSLTIWDSIL